MRWSGLAAPLLFGPLTPVSFRLQGRDALPDAADRVVADARAFGCVRSGQLTSAQRAQLESLASAGADPAVRALVDLLDASHPSGGGAVVT